MNFKTWLLFTLGALIAFFSSLDVSKYIDYIDNDSKRKAIVYTLEHGNVPMEEYHKLITELIGE